jgi:hypothetical protein
MIVRLSGGMRSSKDNLIFHRVHSFRTAGECLSGGAEVSGKSRYTCTCRIPGLEHGKRPSRSKAGFTGTDEMICRYAAVGLISADELVAPSQRFRGLLNLRVFAVPTWVNPLVYLPFDIAYARQIRMPKLLVISTLELLECEHHSLMTLCAARQHIKSYTYRRKTCAENRNQRTRW